MMKKILLKMNLPNGDPNNKNLKKLINLEITIMIVIIIEKINIMEINNLLIDQRISIQEMINMTKIQIIMTEVMMIILTEDVIITTTTRIITLKTMMISITKNMIEITTEHKDLPLLREVEAEAEEGQVEEVITKVTMIEDMIILKTMEIIGINRTSISKDKMIIIKMLLMINHHTINSKIQLTTKTNNQWTPHTKHTCPDLVLRFTTKHQEVI